MVAIFTGSNPTTVGAATKKDHYDKVFENTVWLRQNTPSQALGLILRAHPDNDKAQAQVMLLRADEIVLRSATETLDGERVADWDRLAASLATSGAGGLDTGSEAASTWYEVYAIRKSSDGTKNLLFHRAKDYLLDEDVAPSDDAAFAVRNSASQLEVAQGIQVDTTGLVEFVDIKILRLGSPTGNMWVELKADSSGSPTGAALATSDKLDVSTLATSAQVVRFVFRTPISLTALTQYHLILNADFTVSASNQIQWRGDSSAPAYARGEAKRFNGSTWDALTADMWANVFVTRNDTALTMPTGYDQYAKVGYAYNNGSSNIVPFCARGRVVVPLSVQDLGSVGSGTVPGLVNVAAYVPPVPVAFSVWLRNGENGSCDIRLGPIPDGYNINAGHRTGGLSRYDMTIEDNAPEVQWLKLGMSFHPIHTEYQGFYVRTGAGSIDAFVVSSWEW